MNDQAAWATPRSRGKNLLIVEGNHEKNELFSALFTSFPELGIKPDDIWIYGTNLYILYEEIERHYGSDWDQVDVDLPFLISVRESMQVPCYKRDFVNIFLIFDYERHDHLFHAQKVRRMLTYFADEEDVGKLFINYPMVESYRHFDRLPDPNFESLCVPVSLNPGSAYKAQVRRKCIEKDIEFPSSLEKQLIKLFHIADSRACRDKLLAITSAENLPESVWGAISDSVADAQMVQAKMYLSHLLGQIGHLESGLSYWQHMRRIFIQIIKHNIRKANKLQGGSYQIADNLLKQCFEELDLEAVLIRQNTDSSDPKKAYIWVLNTCVFIVPLFNSSLLEG